MQGYCPRMLGFKSVIIQKSDPDVLSVRRYVPSDRCASSFIIGHNLADQILNYQTIRISHISFLNQNLKAGSSQMFKVVHALSKPLIVKIWKDSLALLLTESLMQL